MSELTPAEIVAELDRHIVGQHDAKRAVAIAIRNRWRRRQLAPEIRDEVMPKNIILIGSTGVGKTEIARRVSRLVRAPFVKVEASKFTEVGYHGRDVESMIRDLVDVAVNLVKLEELRRVDDKARAAAEREILNLLVPPFTGSEEPEERERRARTRETFERKLKNGDLDDREVEVSVDSRSNPMIDVFSSSGVEQFGFDMQSLMQRFGSPQQVTKRLPVSEAREVLRAQEAEKLVDEERVNHDGVRIAQESGIVFLDEIDKIISSGGFESRGPEVSREGVQRDLLPVVEGSTVMTRYGAVKTDHILFIGAGAFHQSRPTDLIPELQGRFPIRVELASLRREDFLRILTEPQNSLPRQYTALLGSEGLKLEFTPEALDRVAEMAWDLNQSGQNIGARRLYALFEKLLEDPLFEAPDLLRPAGGRVTIDREFVDRKLQDLLSDSEQSAYIL